MTDVPINSDELLRNEIMADAERKAKRNVSKAKRSAKKVLDQAAQDAERTAAQVRAGAEMRAKRESASAGASLAAELRRERLCSREQLIRGVFANALEKLVGCDEERRRRMLENLAVGALSVMDGESFVAAVAPEDGALFSRELINAVAGRVGRKIDVRVETDERINGGVMLTTEDGRLLCDNTLRARLERLAPGLRLAVADILFGEGKDND